MPIGSFLSRIGRQFAPQVASTSARTPSFMPDDEEDAPYGPDDPADGPPPATPPMRSAASAMSVPAPPPPDPYRGDDADPIMAPRPTAPRSAASAMSQPPPSMPTPPPAPNTPGGQKIGLGRQIGGALIQGAGMLLPPAAGAARVIGERVAQGTFPEKEREYQSQMAELQARAAIQKEQAAAEETKQRGKLYGQQADTLAVEGKMAPKGNYIPIAGGGIFDASAGKMVREPVTKNPNDYIEIAPEKAKVLGIQPDKDGKYTIPKEGIGPYLTSQMKPEKPVNTTNEYEGVVKEFTGPDGQPDFAKANAAYDKRLAQRALNSRPPSNTQGNFDTARADKSFQYNSGQLEKLSGPVEQRIARMSTLQDTINQTTPQADALIAPELLTVMAGGQGSGLRMNEAEISRVVGGRTNLESIKAALNKWQIDPSKGLSITPAQRQQIKALVKTVNDKLIVKQQTINQAQNDLLNSDDPKMHREIVTKARQALAQVDQSSGTGAGTAAAVDPKVKGYADLYFGGDVAKAMAAIAAQRSGKK